ncbi:calcium/sodium antiporter [Candidatus Peregrinibacteria bacterium]|nr:calcium/sodium antiporter [Candidatus Peregrinibacteria bacterium]
MDILLWTVAFVASLAILIKAADYFTDTAEKIGLIFKIPSFIIGVTIVAVGTSLPEIATSVSAVLAGNSEIVIANVTGSNLANILLVLAIAAIVGKTLNVDKDIIKIDLPILMGSVILLFLTTLDGIFTYIDGILCLLALLTYVLYNIKSERKVEAKDLKDIKKERKEEKKRNRIGIKYPAILIISGIAIILSADFTITSVIRLSEILNIGKEIIAVTAVAIGTSLPELVTSVVAARKGNAGIAIGNITGSNIFNALGVMGIPAFFGTLTIPEEFITFTIPALVFITILYVFVTMDKEISKWEGMTLLLLYAAFIGKTFHLI